MSLCFLFGTLCAGFLAQCFVPGEAPLAILAIGLLSTAFWISVAWARPKVARQMAEGPLAALVLLALGALSILGTLLPQNRSEAFYSESFGRAAPLLRSLGMTDLFHSAAFAALLGLLSAVLAVTCWRRRARTARYLAFASTHLGCLLVLAGAALSFATAEHAQIDLRVGAPAISMAERTQKGRATGDLVSLGAQVRLLAFEVERADQKPRLARYRQMPAGGWKFIDGIAAQPGQAWQLAGGTRIEVVDLFADFFWKEDAFAADAGPSALLVAFNGQSHWLVEGNPCLALTANSAASGTAGAPDFQHLAEQDAAHASAVEICFGALDHITPRDELTAARSRSGAGEAEARARAKAAALSFSSDLGDPNHHAHLMRSMLKAPPEARVIVDPHRRLVQLQARGRSEVRPLVEGLTFRGIALRRFLAAAQYRRTPATRSELMRHPAILIAIDEGDRQDEALLVAASRDAIRLENGDALTLEMRGADITAFQSRLEITDQAGNSRLELLKVNQPVDLDGWKLYQARFDPGDVDFAGLEAVRDRGTPLVFAGFVLLIAGLVALMLLSPRRGSRAGA